ncbi:hypothetical protein [Streptomyces sp. NBC_01244]|uniref:hypothetical protein n=1 Tax=Streptomyces sp. NBC_01244 TaxID=2903797 RepID=UPI002E119841|nr:hypothetical protein OG247_44205 [Streptomyces sp. NBC_01244]
MELKIGNTDKSAGTLRVGRLAMGKTLRRDTPIGMCMNVLRGVVNEIENRESEKKKRRFSWRRWQASTMYYLSVDDVRLLADHPANQELRDLIAAIRDRGPAVDVVLKCS